LKIAVIGFGSVGKRHVKNLLKCGIQNITLLREKGYGNEFGLSETRSLEDLLALMPDLVILANPTGSHHRYLIQLIINNCNILCEKPLVASLDEVSSLESYIGSYCGIGRVAFMMRYHLCVSKVSQLLEEKVIGKPCYGRFFVGQYLPDWRPGTNHMESYSAHVDQGGGVGLDLIHEIDLARYLLGTFSDRFVAISGRVSDVTADSEDVAEIIGKTMSGTILNIHMDYLYRGYRRNFLISGTNGNIHCDFFENRVTITGEHNEVIIEYHYPLFERNEMFLEMLKEILNEVRNPSEKSRIPTFIDNLEIMRIACLTRNETNENS